MRRGIKPRSRGEIIYNILKEISKLEKEGKKTRIMQGDLDWWNFQRYLDFLLEADYITCPEGENCYLTEKGRDLLKRLSELKDTASNRLFHRQF